MQIVTNKYYYVLILLLIIFPNNTFSKNPPKLPSPDLWYNFDTTGTWLYGINPCRLPNYQNGKLDYTSGAQLLLDAGENSVCKTSVSCFSQKHEFTQELINGKMRYTINSKLNQDANSSSYNTIRSWTYAKDLCITGKYAFTISFWIKFSKEAPLNHNVNGSSVISLGETATQSIAPLQGCSIVLADNANKKQLKVVINNIHQFFVDEPLLENQWYHFAISRKFAAKVKDINVYIDGQQKEKIYSNPETAEFQLNISECNLDDSYYFLSMFSYYSQGITISDLRIYNKCLKEELIPKLIK